MVVILLLTPPYTQTEACDGGAASNDSSTSTGDTAIPAYTYKQQQQPKFQYYYYPHSSQYQRNNAYFPACTCQCCLQQQEQQQQATAAPPLPKSQPPYESYIGWNRSHFGGLHQESDKSFFSAKDQWPNAVGHNQQPHYCRQQQVLDNGLFYAASIPTATTTATTTNYSRAIPQSFHIYITNNNNNNNNNNKFSKNICTNTSDFVRHVTRVNFYDVDTSQVEFESKDNHYDDNEQQLDTEAITKEGEYKKHNTKFFYLFFGYIIQTF